MELKNLVGRADLQEQGVWVNIVADFDVKTAYMHRKEARNFVAKEMARARRKMGNINRDVPPEVSRRITIDTLLKFCAKDWRGLTNEGVAIPYSESEARKFFDENPTYLDKLSEEAGDLENFGGKLSDEEKDQGGADGGKNAVIKSEPALDS